VGFLCGDFLRGAPGEWFLWRLAVLAADLEDLDDLARGGFAACLGVLPAGRFGCPSPLMDGQQLFDLLEQDAVCMGLTSILWAAERLPVLLRRPGKTGEQGDGGGA